MDKKVIDLEERIPTLKRRRKRKTNMKFFGLLLILLVLFAIFIYMQSPYSKIKAIKVEGAHLLNQETYLKLLAFKEGDSMWRLPIKESQVAIEEKDIVKKVSIKKQWPRKVNVTVKEWKNVAYMLKDDSYVGVLENGTFYEGTNLTPMDAPLLHGFDNKEERKELSQQLAQLPPEVLALVSQITNKKTETSPYLLQMFMNDSFEVFAMTPTLADKLKYYPEIVAQIPVGEKGVIDLEVGASYRPYNEQYGVVELKEPVDMQKQTQLPLEELPPPVEEGSTEGLETTVPTTEGVEEQ